MKRARVQLARYGPYVALLLLFAVLGTAAGAYVLLKERLPNPFMRTYTLDGAFSTVDAVVPGIGEPVNVAGVHVGVITGVRISNGQGIIAMQIDPHVLPHVYADASANLTPRTPLADMQVNVFPGHPSAGGLSAGATIPAGATTSPVSSDDFLAALDTDTRTWLTSLVTDLDTGTRGRSSDLHRLFAALGPTSTDLRAVSAALATRRRQISDLVHNLDVLTHAASTRDAQLIQVVRAGQQTLAALAGQNVALNRAIRLLPGTLTDATQTLSDTARFSKALAPTARALTPTARRLPALLRELPTAVRGAALVPARQAIPFTNAMQPVVRLLPSLTSNVKSISPALRVAFNVLTYVVNEATYDPGGKNPGFLYWFPWFAHDVNSFLSNEDANGPMWRGAGLISCSDLSAAPVGQLLTALLGAASSSCSHP